VNDAPLPPGARLGKYLIVRLIGSGGMGAVYEATHLELRKRMAIKTLLPSLAVNPEARARFLREGEAASRIDHPNVVNVTDTGNEGNIPFLVMEFLDGENLAERLVREGGLTVPALLELLLPIMDALAHGHDEGVVHRDLKPHNIFLSRSGDGRLVPKLLDYGVSKLVDDDRSSALTGSLAVLGTAQYMAPEQIDGPKNVDARTDQYAMGLVIFECLTGRPARQGTSPLAILRSVASEQVPSLREAGLDVDPGFEAVITRALRFHPGARFSSMRDLMRALLPFAPPRTRQHWGEAIIGHPEPVEPSANLPRTLMLPDSAPASRLAPSTTFRNTSGEVLTDRRAPRSRALLVVGVVALLAVGAFAVSGALDLGYTSGRRHPAPPAMEPPPAPPARQRREIRAMPAEATIRVDGVVLGHSPVVTEVRPGAHELVVSAPGYRAVTVEFADDTPLPPLIELAAEAPPPAEPATASPHRPRPHPGHRTRLPARGDDADQPAKRGVNDSLIIP
jgi:serine/threonine protein kinase